ncbi:unnamed protein product [Caenorhabditis sp. 36 PRJEB53466]|nr:unnamed protein product [Caenorhabditis sp. 36 PRJEB53466]
MPTVGIKKVILDKHFNRVYSEKEFDELCFEYGLELDEITSEKAAVEKERGAGASGDLNDQEVYKIDIPANRYDLLSVEGLARAIRIFKQEVPAPEYKFAEVPKGGLQKIIVKKETAAVRPQLRFLYRSARQAAPKHLPQAHSCSYRNARLGHHSGTVEYRAEAPKDIKFKPLNQTKEYTAEELMTLYSSDSHLKAYLPIIQNHPRYPVIYDKNGVVCSMPPIINGEHSKITLKTKNVFIEATATDKQKAFVVLDTIVALFSQYCAKPFTVEQVEVIYEETGVKEVYPLLSYREMTVTTPEINTKIGLSLQDSEMATLLNKMSLKAEVVAKETMKIVVPPTRHDILHACDIAEDVGVAFGYNNLVLRLPESNTVAVAFPINKLCDNLRIEIAAAGWTEALNFALCSRDDISSKLRQSEALNQAVHIGNPKTLEFQVARTSLLPGLLKTLASNRDMPLPLKLFELQDVIVKDPSTDVGARNERRLASVFYNKSAGFEVIQAKDGTGYYIEADENPTYFPGRCAKIVGPKGVLLGHIGALHPEVITSFGLTLPCAAVEFNVEPFL